jgi:omega-6 fatty acid desaturase (delta-12 desaturase)
MIGDHMSLSSTCASQSNEVDPLPALAELKPVLTRFQKRSASRALIQVANSLAMYVLLWCAIYWSWRFSYALALCLTFLAGLWVVRVFIIMHDCGHGSFTQSKLANNIIGNIAGLMVFMPYYHWRWEHAIHHNTSGDLGRRGIGDVWTMTVEEYLNSSPWRRFIYAVTRNPSVLFSIAPLLVFLCLHRVPARTAPRREFWSVWATNTWVLALWVTLSVVFGWRQFLITQLLITMVGGGIGIWLFYVQHQFEDAYWTPSEEWSYLAAALRGSSFYRLPKMLQWFSGSIGFHHIHHLSPSIPNYNLQLCHAAHPAFARAPTITLRTSLACAKLKLWDERTRQLVSFQQLKSRTSAKGLAAITKTER